MSWREILGGLSEGSGSSGIGGRGEFEQRCQEVMRKRKEVACVSKDEQAFTKLTNSADLGFGTVYPLPPVPLHAVFQNK